MESKSGLRIAVCEERVRIGNNSDGGYVLCKNDLQVSTGVLSFGVNDDWSFEKAISLRMQGIGIDCYDFSISRNYFFENYSRVILRFFTGRLSLNSFLRALTIPFAYIFFFRGRIRHFQERVTNTIRRSGEIDIASIFSRTQSLSVIVKVDIEGAEYKIINDLLMYRDRISTLIVEFHEIDFLKEKFIKSLREISEYFDLIHVHGNNHAHLDKSLNVPSIIEMTFSRIGVHSQPLDQISCPTKGLDFPNNLEVSDFSFTLYSSITAENY